MHVWLATFAAARHAALHALLGALPIVVEHRAEVWQPLASILAIVTRTAIVVLVFFFSSHG